MKVECANSLDARAALRQKCLCLEEYLIKRDLEFNMSKLEKALDSIALVEKHPKFFPIVDGKWDDSWFKFFTIITMSVSHVSLTVIIKLAFSDASQSSLSFGSLFSVLGLGCIIIACYMRILDTMFALHRI